MIPAPITQTDEREEVRCRYLVACDGINSAIRKQFVPGDKIAFSGINTWRGVTTAKPFLGGRTYIRAGSINTGKIVIYPIADDVDNSDEYSEDLARLIREQSALPGPAGN